MSANEGALRTTMNPVIKRMAKAKEVTENGEKAAAYAGIKTVYFVLVI